MTATPAEVTDAVYEEAARHFSEAQLVELAATAAMENYRAPPQPRLPRRGAGLLQAGGGVGLKNFSTGYDRRRPSAARPPHPDPLPAGERGIRSPTPLYLLPSRLPRIAVRGLRAG